LANEVGDIMFVMEHNDKALKESKKARIDPSKDFGGYSNSASWEILFQRSKDL